MDTVFQAAACAVSAALLALLIRRSNPELGLALSLAGGLVLVLLTVQLSGPVFELAELVQELTGAEGALLAPVGKCVCIGIITRLAGDLCRDAGQSYIAGAVELLGSVAALAVAAPLFVTLLTMIGDLQ
jgi:stage III sporulation protein AD